MKRLFICLLAAVFLAGGLLTGCANVNTKPDDEKPLSIVCTVFPAYDWVRQILGERADTVNLTLLLDSGVDLHNYQPTADDILTVASCDLFVYVGGESDGWVEDALRQSTNPNLKTVNLMEALAGSIKEEELVEGMQAEEEHGEEEEEAPEYDEHIWLSLNNAEVAVNVLAETLGQLDAQNAQTYAANAEKYDAQLGALNEAYREAVQNAPVKTLLFADRFPFRYLADDYGLTYYAAFVGCSAETEASFETVLFLAQKIDELQLHSVCVIEGSNGAIANAVIGNTAAKNQQILTLDSLQSVSATDAENGASYLSIMGKNLEVLKLALGVKEG